jgi:ribose 5-phosphate isomerase B
MKIAVGADHRGTEAARALAQHLRAQGHEILDAEVCDGTSCDYPDKAFAVARAVSTGSRDVGVLICGSGIGMSIAANKVNGIRAALVSDAFTAEVAKRHNNANVLCLSGDLSSPHEIITMVNAWLNATFEGGRHQRRLDKVAAIEAGLEPSSITPAST